jgi:hypothetical protein
VEGGLRNNVEELEGGLTAPLPSTKHSAITRVRNANIMGVIIMRPQDTLLVARSIKRVRKGVYDITLYHPSGRKYGEERFSALNQEDALRRCRLIYPSVTRKPAKASAMPVAKPAPYPFCRHPDKCAGKGYCPRDPACND